LVFLKVDEVLSWLDVFLMRDNALNILNLVFPKDSLSLGLKGLSINVRYGCTSDVASRASKIKMASVFLKKETICYKMVNGMYLS